MEQNIYNLTISDKIDDFVCTLIYSFTYLCKVCSIHDIIYNQVNGHRVDKIGNISIMCKDLNKLFRYHIKKPP